MKIRNQKSDKKSSYIYDERQIQITHKSYVLSYWFVMFVLYIALLVEKNSFLINFAFWGSLTLNFCYSTLKGASPFAEPRFGKFGKYGRVFGIIAIVLGLIIFFVSIVVAFIKDYSLWEIFTAKSSFVLVMALFLICMGASILYRHYLNKKEAVE